MNEVSEEDKLKMARSVGWDHVPRHGDVGICIDNTDFEHSLIKGNKYIFDCIDIADESTGILFYSIEGILGNKKLSRFKMVVCDGCKHQCIGRTEKCGLWEAME